MPHMFVDNKVPSKRIDNYVKLFLSSCNRLHALVAQATEPRSKVAPKKKGIDQEKEALSQKE